MPRAALALVFVLTLLSPIAAAHLPTDEERACVVEEETTPGDGRTGWSRDSRCSADQILAVRASQQSVYVARSSHNGSRESSSEPEDPADGAAQVASYYERDAVAVGTYGLLYGSATVGCGGAAHSWSGGAEERTEEGASNRTRSTTWTYESSRSECLAAIDADGYDASVGRQCGGFAMGSTERNESTGGGETQVEERSRADRRSSCHDGVVLDERPVAGTREGCAGEAWSRDASSSSGGWTSSRSSSGERCSAENAYLDAGPASAAQGSWTTQEAACSNASCYERWQREDGLLVAAPGTRVLVGSREQATAVCDGDECARSGQRQEGVFVALIAGQERHVPLALP